MRSFLIAVVIICSQLTLGSCYDAGMALQLGYMSAVAYESASSINSWSCSYCHKYVMASPSTFYNSSGNIQGFVAYNPRRNSIVVAFRGSQDIKNWIVNLDTSFSTYDGCGDCKVHSGFLGAYKSIAAQMKQHISALLSVHRGVPIQVTGHSLGGALALLAAIDIKHTYNFAGVYAFGCPRVGNSNFAQYISGSLNGFRVIHYDDIVPHIPPYNFGFVHGVLEIWYSKGMLSYQQCPAESPSCANSIPTTSFSVSDHDLDKYLQLKGLKVGSFAQKIIDSLRTQLIRRFNPIEKMTSLQQENQLRMVNEVLKQLGGSPLVINN